MQKKILLITKNYPPQIGGIEQYSYELNKTLSKSYSVILIKANPRNINLEINSKKNLIIHFLYLFSEVWRLLCFLKNCIYIGIKERNKVDIIWTCDGSLSGIGFFLGKIGRKKEIITVFHGKDLAWENKIYQKMIHYFCQQQNSIRCVSKSIYNLAVLKWVPEKLLLLDEHKISNFSFPEIVHTDRNYLIEKYKISSEKILLFSIGRFVEKKWFWWFIKTVLPKIDKNNFHYILVGYGPLLEQYKKDIKALNIKNISIIWPIQDPLEKALFFKETDYFIMPNISTEGDFEWYGLVLLEAHHFWSKCIISDADGLSERAWKKDEVLPQWKSDIWVNYLEKIALDRFDID